MRTVNHRKVHLVLFVALTGCANLPAPLDSIAAELRERRSMPVGTSTDCPENSKSLIGTTSSQVKAALGRPDLESRTEITYYFGSPWIVGQAGGGSPELTFIVGKRDLVTDVLCLYSQ